VASEIRHSRRHCSVCDEDKILIKSLYLKGYTATRLIDEFSEKSCIQSVVLISCSKSCRTQAQLRGGQAAADRAVPLPAQKKTLSFFFRSSRSLPLTLFCRLSGEATKNTFSSVKKTFTCRGQFAPVSSCAQRLLKHFRCKSLQIIQDRDDRWIPVSRDILQTDLCVCGLLSSWLRTKLLTVSTFSSVRTQTDGKSK